MIIIFFDTKVPQPRGKVRAQGRRLAGRHAAAGQSRQANGQMGTCRWPVGPLDRQRKGRQMDEQRMAIRQTGGRAGGLAGWQGAGGRGQAGGRAVFAAMPLKNHVAPAEDLEQGA